MKYLASISVAAISLILFNIATSHHQANAQQTSTTTGTNFTKLLSQEEFHICKGNICTYPVKVLYQGPIMLVFDSVDMGAVWKAVEIAKKEGYKVDGISTYNSLSVLGTVAVLVAMSKG